MSTRIELLKRIQDGRFHSGTELGAQLRISRAAVCKHVATLCAAGLEIHRVSGRGYRLATPVVPLDRAAIVTRLKARGLDLDDRLELLESVDSTNRHLLARAAELPVGSVCLAEAQPAGRGRRGRAWVTTPYHNLIMSFAWRFAAGPAAVTGFSLAAGLACAQALEEYGVTGAGLKWPNDVLWRDRKLAGLLIEVQGEAAGPSFIVVGIGINVCIAPRDATRIDQPWVDLHTILDAPVDRNRLAALVIARLHEVCRVFGERGFAPLRAEWERRHVYHGRVVRLIDGAREQSGMVEGVDTDGALVVCNRDGVRRAVHSGEISLRAAP